MQSRGEIFDIDYFLKELDSEDIQSILYNDRLEAKVESHLVGSYTVSVKKNIYESQETLQIGISGELSYDRIFQQFSIETYATMSLETIYQKYHEKIKLKNSPPKLFSSVLTKTGNKYFVRISETADQQTVVRNEETEIMPGRVYFSSGSKIVLLRMLAQKNVSANFGVDFVTKLGKVGECHYTPLSNKTVWANNESNVLVGYQETEKSGDRPGVVNQCMMARDGHLITMQQVAIGFTLRAVKFPLMLSLRQPRDKYIPQKEKLEWRSDMEMFSKYLDYKQIKKNKFEFYLRSNPQLGRLLSDLLQSLLLNKPDDVPRFLVDYFMLY